MYVCKAESSLTVPSCLQTAHPATVLKLCALLYRGSTLWHASLHMPESGSTIEGCQKAPSQLQGKLLVDDKVRLIFFEPCKHPTATVCLQKQAGQAETSSS